MSCVFRQPSAIVAVGLVQNVTKFRVRASHNVVSCNRQRLECMRVAAGGKRLLFITFSLRGCVCVCPCVCLSRFLCGCLRTASVFVTAAIRTSRPAAASSRRVMSHLHADWPEIRHIRPKYTRCGRRLDEMSRRMRQKDACC